MIDGRARKYKGLRGGVPKYVAQVPPVAGFDAEIVEKGHLWIETRYNNKAPIGFLLHRTNSSFKSKIIFHRGAWYSSPGEECKEERFRALESEEETSLFSVVDNVPEVMSPSHIVMQGEGDMTIFRMLALRPLHNLASLFRMRFLTHVRLAH